MDEDLNQLKYKLSALSASIPTTNGGGIHGYIGMLLKTSEYITCSYGGMSFVTQTNPGVYPVAVNTMDMIIKLVKLQSTKQNKLYLKHTFK